MTTATTGARDHQAGVGTGTAAGTVRGGGITPGRVFRSEWIKLRSLRSTVCAVLAVVLGIVLVGAFTAVGIVVKETVPASEAVAADPSGGTLSGVGVGQLAAIAFGVLAVTAEYRSLMIRSSFTAVPGRLPLVWAKATLATAVTAVVSLLALLVTFLVARTVVATDGPSLSLTAPGVGRAVIGAAVVLGMTSALATSFGWLLRSTAGAVSALVGLLYILPSLVGVLPQAVADKVLPYLPGNAVTAVIHITTTGDALTPWAGLAVYAAYTALALAAAALVVQRRDA